MPDARGPARHLLWLVRRQPRRVLFGVVFSSTWMVGLVVPPYLISRAVDDGLRRHDLAALGGWVGLILLAGMVNSLIGIMRHRTMTFIRLDAGLRTVEVVVRHAAGVGAELPRQVSTGEVVAIGAADLDRIMRAMTVTGPGVGAVVSYAVVAILLVGIAPLLALVVLLGVPAMLLSLGPLLHRAGQPRRACRGRGRVRGPVALLARRDLNRAACLAVALRAEDLAVPAPLDLGDGLTPGRHELEPTGTWTTCGRSPCAAKSTPPTGGRPGIVDGRLGDVGGRLGIVCPPPVDLIH